MGPLHTYITAKHNMYYTYTSTWRRIGHRRRLSFCQTLSWSVNIKTTTDVIIAEKRVCLSKCGT